MERWQSKPGSFDALNASRLFPSTNRYGIPDLLHTPLSAIPQTLVPYRARIRSQHFDPDQAGVHFFLDDYRFETVWTRPVKALAHLRKYHTLLTPDFSLYADWPLAMQMWNVYRSRWLGRWWQELGFQVIPTVSWSTPESFEFCFAGLPTHSMVAVSLTKASLSENYVKKEFIAGLGRLSERIEPSTLVVYGSKGLYDKFKMHLSRYGLHCCYISTWLDENLKNISPDKS